MENNGVKLNPKVTTEYVDIEDEDDVDLEAILAESLKDVGLNPRPASTTTSSTQSTSFIAPDRSYEQDEKQIAIARITAIHKVLLASPDLLKTFLQAAGPVLGNENANLGEDIVLISIEDQQKPVRLFRDKFNEEDVRLYGQIMEAFSGAAEAFMQCSDLNRESVPPSEYLKASANMSRVTQQLIKEGKAEFITEDKKEEPLLEKGRLERVEVLSIFENDPTRANQMAVHPEFNLRATMSFVEFLSIEDNVAFVMEHIKDPTLILPEGNMQEQWRTLKQTLPPQIYSKLQQRIAPLIKKYFST